jgi:hypothetical protein
MKRYLYLLTSLILLQGCASKRILYLENRVLKQDLDDLKASLQMQPDTEPSLDTLKRHISSLQLPFQVQNNGAYITATCPGNPIPFSAQVFEDNRLFYVATTELFNLHDSHSTSGAFAVMAQISTLNYDLPLAKVALNEQTGQVIVSVQLPADNGLTSELVTRAIVEVCTSAERIRPVLEKAARGNGL